MRILALLGACMALSCGGSASEAPWPAEPIDLEPGPAGETRKKGNVMDTSKLPDNYTKKKKQEAGVPEEDDETIDKEEAPDADPEEESGEGEGEEEEEAPEEE